MKIYDVTRPITADMAVFPGDAKPLLEWLGRTDSGSKINLSKLSLGMHTGTHVDSPFHFIANGENLDTFSLDHYFGKCRVVEIAGDMITRDDVMRVSPKRDEIILFKTRNSFISLSAPFTMDYAAFTLDAAEYLAESGVKTVGVDYLSIERSDCSGVHMVLLGAGIGAIEGLDLSAVPPGEYFLSALPIKAAGAEGAPVRAVLAAL